MNFGNGAMGMRIHVVQSGDNLWLLSQRYGVGINQIASVNELPDPNQLVVGLALVIPTPPIKYRVHSGDTLWRIAQRYGTSAEAIAQANQITAPYLIYVGQSLIIPDKPKRTIDVNAFITRFGAEGRTIVTNVARHLTYLCPFAYRIQANGGLEPLNDASVIQAAVSGNAVPLMSITNFSSTAVGSNLAHTILASPELQNTLLTNIISTMKNKGYRGLNIDFESVLPSDRELYNQFIRRAVTRLHPEGFSVSSSLAPKTSAAQKGLLYEAHDYAAHGAILDFVVLMTYEWGYRLGPPQAISPLNQIRAVLDYAVTVIPRNKILMGFQLYARDWLLPHVQGQQAETFSMQEAIHRALQHGATIQYDPSTQSPFYQYTDAQGRSHEVWFEDARSAQAKFDTVKIYNLLGISYWELGYPFPQNWALLEDNFHVRKL
jgi:spore germination protein